MGSRVYLDNHTITRPSSGSTHAITDCLRKTWGAITSPHQIGEEAFLRFAQSTEEILRQLGGNKEDQFHFCHSGAEAIHTVLFSHYLEEVRESGKNHILTTNIEEAPTLLGLKRLEQFNCVEQVLPVNLQGQVTASMVAEAIKPKTSLLSLSWANSLTGVIHPIADIAEVCFQKGIRLHVDAGTVIGKLFFHFKDLNIDYLTFDGSLIHGPTGTAGIIMNNTIPFHPLIPGQSNVDTSGIAALAHALSEASSHFEHLNLETARLKRQLEIKIKEGFSEAVVLFKHVEQLPNCTTICFPGVESEALLYLLNRKGIDASMGGGQTQKLYHTLTSCGIDPLLARSALSFCLSHETTEAEIAYAAEIIIKCALQLRRCSIGICGGDG
jgi:cysteine desulfurase